MLENDDNYLYFFHGTNESNEESFFSQGLIDYRGGELRNTTWQYTEDIYGNDISDSVKEYTERNSYNHLILVKIPFRIVNGTDRNGVPYIPIPIWKNTEETDGFGRNKAILIPELIAGMYHKDEDTFVENPQYSTAFNPNGLSYDLLQIEHLQSSGQRDWLDFAEERRNHTYEELFESDAHTKPFDGLVKFYKQKGIMKNTRTISSSDFLKWGIDRGERIGSEKFKAALNRAATFFNRIFDRTRDE